MHAVLAVVVVVSATVLAAFDVLDSSSVTVIYGAALGFAGGTASSLGSLTTAVNGKATMSDATLRQAIGQPAAHVRTSGADITVGDAPPGDTPQT